MHVGRPANHSSGSPRSNTIPSAPEHRKKLYNMVREAVDAKLMIDAQNDKLNNVRQAIMDEFPITTKLLGQLIQFMYKGDYDQKAAEWDEISVAFENMREAGENPDIRPKSLSAEEGEE